MCFHILILLFRGLRHDRSHSSWGLLWSHIRTPSSAGCLWNIQENLKVKSNQGRFRSKMKYMSNTELRCYRGRPKKDRLQVHACGRRSSVTAEQIGLELSYMYTHALTHTAFERASFQSTPWGRRPIPQKKLGSVTFQSCLITHSVWNWVLGKPHSRIEPILS